MQELQKLAKPENIPIDDGTIAKDIVFQLALISSHEDLCAS